MARIMSRFACGTPPMRVEMTNMIVGRGLRPPVVSSRNSLSIRYLATEKLGDESMGRIAPPFCGCIFCIRSAPVDRTTVGEGESATVRGECGGRGECKKENKRRIECIL